MCNEYITWNTEKNIFQDQNDLEKILVLDVEYEKQNEEWYHLTTVRAFSTANDVLEYYYTETFPRLVAWSSWKYEGAEDMKISIEDLIEKLESLYGKKEENIKKIKSLQDKFLEYMKKKDLSLKELENFKKELEDMDIDFGVTKFNIEYIGDADGLMEIALSYGGMYLDDVEYPEVELINYLTDFD